MRGRAAGIRVAHAPGAAGYLDLLWLRNSGRDAASANNEPRAPTHARIGKPRKHKQGLKGRAGGVCMSNMVSRKKPSVRAPIRGQSGRAGGQAPALQAAIETCAAADAAVPGALRAASLRRLAAQDARMPRRRGHICWRTRLWRSRHPRTRERGDRGGTGRLRGGAGQLGGCKRVLLWCIQPPVAPRARPINMTGTPVPLYCAPRRHALHRGEKQSKLCGPGSRGPPHAEVPVVGSGGSALPPRPGAGSAPRSPPRATAAHHVVSHTERGPTAAATLRGSPPPQAFCGSLLSAHRCRFGTYCAVASFPEVPIPAWPPGSLLPDGRRHLSAGSTAAGHVPPPAAMSNTSAVQPARSALALGLLGKQAMVDGCLRRQ